MTDFAYRLVRPAFAGDVVEATARRAGASLDLAVGTEQGGPSLTATATLGPAPENSEPTPTDEVGAP